MRCGVKEKGCVWEESLGNGREILIGDKGGKVEYISAKGGAMKGMGIDEHNQAQL